MIKKNVKVNKRFPNYNVDIHAIKSTPKHVALDIYKKICESRYFEQCVIDAYKAKKIIAPVYLSLGQESVAAALSSLITKDYIFSGHRAHDVYISIGADLKELRDELLGLETGCSKGRAGSSCLKYLKKGYKFMPHHGLIGEQVPQAVGMAIATKKRVVTIFGDGAAEEDYVLESLGYAGTHSLPILFVCMDNDLSILTKTSVRRKWELVDVAHSFNIPNAFDVADDPFTIYNIVKKWDGKSPFLINCRVCREMWHSGIGIDGEREWCRNEIVRKQLINMHLKEDIIKIEKNAYTKIIKIWEKYL